MLFEKNDRIIFMGDSVTDCGRKRPVGEGLAEGVGAGYVRTIESFLNVYYPELNLRITNMGISGNTIAHLQDRWQTDILDLNPDWVSILIGVNDVWRQFDEPAIPESAVQPEEFEAIYRELIEKTQDGVKGIILITPHFYERYKQDPMRTRLDEYGSIVKKLAKEYGCLFIDTQTVFDQFMENHYAAYLSADRVHPNYAGRTLLAITILKAIGFDFGRL